MYRKSTLAIVAIALAAFALSDLADARRMGGGRSLGTQRSVTPPPAASSSPNVASQPVMPAQPGATLSRPAAPAAAPAPAPSRSRWLGPLAGIAAGLGLAALFSHFGLSEGFGSMLLLLLVVFGGVMLLRLFLARRSAPLQYAGASPAAREPVFGNDTPAWGGGAPASAAPASRTNARIPAGFDIEGFVREAKTQFARLQAAYDTGDVRALADVMTPAMLNEVKAEIASRGTHQPTQIVSLDGELLEVVTEGDRHWASVRFTGLSREDGARDAQRFDETWNLSKPVDDGTGWLLAGIQQNEAAGTSA